MEGVGRTGGEQANTLGIHRGYRLSRSGCVYVLRPGVGFMGGEDPQPANQNSRERERVELTAS